MSTFTPVSPLPEAQLPRSVCITPPFHTAGNGDHDIAPGLRFDAQGTLWVAHGGDFTDLYSEGTYCGPRPVVEVVHVHSLDMVIVVTDQDVYLMSAEEYHAQV